MYMNAYLQSEVIYIKSALLLVLAQLTMAFQCYNISYKKLHLQRYNWLNIYDIYNPYPNARLDYDIFLIGMEQSSRKQILPEESQFMDSNRQRGMLTFISFYPQLDFMLLTHLTINSINVYHVILDFVFMWMTLTSQETLMLFLRSTVNLISV